MTTLVTKCDRSYPLIHPELVEARILPGEAQSGDGCVAQLREISPASAKLLLQGPPELSARCWVLLRGSKLARTLKIAAQIDWVRPNSAGDWLVECEFQPRLSDATFNELLASGLLERRAAVRFQTRIAVGVEWRPGQPRIPGIVRDISEGGLCLCLVTREAPPDTRDVRVVAVTPHGETALALKVRWSLQVGGEYLIGCQFMNGDDFSVLRNLQPAASEHLHEHSRAGKPARDRM